MKVLTRQEARKIQSPIVYGLVDPGDGRVVYVGKTINPANRLQIYTSPSMCHNKMLGEWLADNHGMWRVAILESDPADLNAAERRHIRMRRSSLLNLMGGGDDMWKAHSSQPWMAGPGKKCPSDLLLTFMKRNDGCPSVRGSIKEARVSMSILERCKYEIALAMWIDQEMYGLMPSVSKWLENTNEKILPILAAE
jgi:hypothetical protein